jgi:DNA-binding transcriptional regulator YiaG
MRSAAKAITLKQAALLKQLEVEVSFQSLCNLTKLSQERFAVLGFCFGTVSRWENGSTKSSQLALRQIHALVDQLSQFSRALRAEGERFWLEVF